MKRNRNVNVIFTLLFFFLREVVLFLHRACTVLLTSPLYDLIQFNNFFLFFSFVLSARNNFQTDNSTGAWSPLSQPSLRATTLARVPYSPNAAPTVHSVGSTTATVQWTTTDDDGELNVFLFFILLIQSNFFFENLFSLFPSLLQLTQVAVLSLVLCLSDVTKHVSSSMHSLVAPKTTGLLFLTRLFVTPSVTPLQQQSSLHPPPPPPPLLLLRLLLLPYFLRLHPQRSSTFHGLLPP